MESLLTETSLRTTANASAELVQSFDLPACAVFTAVEGALLDFGTFDGTAARPVVRQLHAAGVPLIPVTVMTIDEMEPIARNLGIRGPMIVEAGNAVARRRGTGWQLQQIGVTCDVILDAICEIERMTGADLLVYSAMSERDCAKVSGRRGEMLRGSMRTRFSEPFLVERGDLDEVIRAAGEIGFSVHRGKRFFHLTMAGLETRAYDEVRRELRCEIAIAAGGSPVDEEFMRRSEIPIIIPKQDGEPDAQLFACVPNVMIAPAPGSAGWAAAVSHVWHALQVSDSETASA